MYRLFSVPAGRYVVSIGVDAKQAMMGSGQGAAYPKTYHPATSDAAAATVVDVSAGSEAKGIDIVVGRPGRTFRVTGRIVEAESGKPIPNTSLQYGTLVTQNGREFARSFYGGAPSDAKGQFQFADLAPGRYAVSLSSFGDKPPEYFSDPVVFEIAGADVSGLEIKAHPGASLSGTATVEGADDAGSARAALSQFVLSASRKDDGGGAVTMMSSANGRIERDGSFRITGLKGGEYSLHLGNWRGPKGYSLARVEREGVESRARISLADGEQVTGLRVVIAYGTGVIKGQVKLENGSTSETTQVWIAWRKAGEEIYIGSTQADARRQFLIEGLATGEYEVLVRAFDRTIGTKPATATKTVSVTSGATSEVTIAIDIAPKEEGGDK
jgi:hypothetical protein